MKIFALLLICEFLNSEFFLTKLSGIDLHVKLVNWCKWSGCGSTYMVVRLSHKRPLQSKKHIHSLLNSEMIFYRTAWQLLTTMIILSIASIFNKINLLKFGQTRFTIQKFTKSEFTNFQFKNSKFSLFHTYTKVIYTKYSKHWLDTVVH